ncbi:MAG: adenylate/guanylate cyclase domain-containing protein [Desulfobacterales bacterium]
MKCPQCQFDNREGAKFCKECGAKLDLACSQCGNILPPDSKFCDECGFQLTPPAKYVPKELSFDEKLTKIQKYLPKGLTEKIIAQKDRIEGERKRVAVMFCDMAGFTSLSEQLGPEDAYSIMDKVYEILIHKVHDFEGTVNEMTGDGILALFGAPITLEDAPQRAIRSSLAIHREMLKFSNRLKQDRKDIPSLKMRIGIHTGLVVVGTLGNDLRVEFKAVGDTVNIASRIEGLAEAGTTWVSEETFKRTEGFFRFEALGRRKIKGKQEAVKVYQVIAPSTRRTRFDVSAAVGLTPFVGRERELEILIDSFTRVKMGRGQAASIVAEAGVGKSRLLYEFRKAVSSEDTTFLEGRCLSYSKGVAYHLHADILKANFDIQETDKDSEVKNKVRRGLQVLGLDEASNLPYLLELLGVRESGIDRIQMSLESKKDRIIETLKRFALKGCENRPLILAYEDLHWMDQNSEEVLKSILESIPETKILLIFTYRPEFVHTWGSKSFHSQLNLNRFSNTESLKMVSYLLGTADIDSDLEELVLEKTEGVPFFIEEFIKSLKDLNVIQRTDNTYGFANSQKAVIIPSTIHDVIMARVDSLPEGAKEVLQNGSLIEREFGYELIKQVTGLTEPKLLTHLSALKDAELLYERGIYPKSTYIFKHALTQEVVQGSIITRRKKKLHEIIGNAIEALYTDNIAEYYEVLAEHFIESELFEKAAEHSKLAGKKAQKAASFKDAIEYARKTIFCLEKLPRSDRTQRKIIDARTRLAGYYLSLDHYVEAKEAVAPIADLALELNYQKRLPIIYTVMGTYSQWVEEDYSKAFRYLEQALKISKEMDDDTSLWFASFFLGIARSLNCEFEKGLEYFRKSLDLGFKAKNPIMIVFAKGLMSTFNYIFYGKADLACQLSLESLQMAKESEDIYLKGMAYSSCGMACYCKGLFEEAENRLSQALPLCKKTALLGWETWGTGFLGHAYVAMGNYKKALDTYSRGISILEPVQLFPFWINLWKIAIARLNVLSNKTDINLSKVFECYENIKVKIAQGWAARYVAEILLNLDNHHLSEAEDWAQKALETDKSNGTMWSLGCDYTFYAELHKYKGHPEKARENLNRAIEIFSQCGAEGWQNKAEKEMAALA